MTAAPVRVLELRSVRGTGGGPEKTILLGAAMADPARVHVTVCYLRDARDDVFHVDERARRAGVEYLEIVERHSLDPAIWRPLKQLVADRRIDIVHAHEYKTDLLAWLLSRRTGAVPLATAHGWTGHSRRERLVYYPADKRVLRRFPLVLAVSTEVKQDLLRHGVAADRVRVLLNGIDPEAFRRNQATRGEARARFGVGPGEIAVGAVGRLEPQKRFDLLIRAAAAVHRDEPRLRLLIAGEGSARAVLEDEIRAAGDWCRLVGHLDDVREFHQALDLFVQSSVYEGTPNAVLEAMAMETPLVVTDAGGTAEVVRAGMDGLVVPAGDQAALEHAVRQALADPEGSLRRARSARARVETELSFERRVRTLDRIYLELASSRRP